MKVWVVYDATGPLAAFSSDSWANVWQAVENVRRDDACEEHWTYVREFDLDEKLRVGNGTDVTSLTKSPSPPA